jgi:HlyD family secretion protein
MRIPLFALALTSLAAAQAVAPAPEVIPVRKGNARSTLERKGTLVPADAAELSIWPENWSGELLVLEAVPHGTPVNEGDVLVRFDLRKVDEQLRQSEFDLSQAEQKLKSGEEETRIAEEAGQAELTRAERENDWAQRRLKGFLTKEQEFKKDRERMSEQSENNWIEDQRDELTQLEKMYKEDELVDATEEIVLKRSRRGFAMLQQNVDLTRRTRAYGKELADAIQKESVEFEATQKAAALDRQRRSSELKRGTRGLDHAKSRLELEKQRTNLERLRRDRDLLVVRAPRRGILLHGKPDAAPGAGKLEKGSTVRVRDVFLTVAEPGKFKVQTDVTEADLLKARTGTAAEVSVPALDVKWVAPLRVSALPTSRGSDGENLYEGTIALEKDDPRLRSGMRCKVTAVLEEVRDVVLIPNRAVSRKGDKATAKVGKSKEGPFEERSLSLGFVDGKDVVVKDGVAEGEYVQCAGADK